MAGSRPLFRLGMVSMLLLPESLIAQRATTFWAMTGQQFGEEARDRRRSFTCAGGGDVLPGLVLEIEDWFMDGCWRTRGGWSVLEGASTSHAFG